MFNTVCSTFFQRSLLLVGGLWFAYRKRVLDCLGEQIAWRLDSFLCSFLSILLESWVRCNSLMRKPSVWTCIFLAFLKILLNLNRWRALAFLSLPQCAFLLLFLAVKSTFSDSLSHNDGAVMGSASPSTSTTSILWRGTLSVSTVELVKVWTILGAIHSVSYRILHV